MSRDGGDQAYHGEKVSYDTAQDIDPGLAVVPSGDFEVDLADANGAGGNLIGVMQQNNPRYGDDYTVVQRGVVKVRVEEGVAAGDELAVPDSSGSGTPGVLGAGGDTGWVVVEGAIEDDDGNYYALAHLG